MKDPICVYSTAAKKLLGYLYKATNLDFVLNAILLNITLEPVLDPAS